ncbi:MAG: hypothetical protein AAF846_28490 [Chloroflexota bacterium]
MRLFVSSLIIVWFTLLTLTMISIKLPLNNICGAYPALELITAVRAQRTVFDWRTGNLWQHPFTPSAYWFSPDGRYHLTRPDNHIVITDTQTDERVNSLELQTFVNLTWTEDSQSILIWEYLGDSAQNQVTSLDMVTGAIRFQEQYDTELRWRRQDRRNTDYLYSQLILPSDNLQYGVQFLDTETGTITQFEQPTQFLYHWSRDGRYVASVYRETIQIIDPATGDYHPNFPQPIAGDDIQWQADDALWFNRTQDEQTSIWQAHLTDGILTQTLIDAELEAIAPNGEWAYIYDQTLDDMALVHLASGQRHAFSLIHDGRRTRSHIDFSPNRRCAVLQINDMPQGERLLIFDLMNVRVLREAIIVRGQFNDLLWVTHDEIPIADGRP